MKKKDLVKQLATASSVALENAIAAFEASYKADDEGIAELRFNRGLLYTGLCFGYSSSRVLSGMEVELAERWGGMEEMVDGSLVAAIEAVVDLACKIEGEQDGDGPEADPED